jgi:hypothetical protein
MRIKMSKVNFFTAVSFGDHRKTGTQKFLEGVDDYFYLGGKKACVIAGESQKTDKGTLLMEQESLFTAVKVFSYFTGFVPVIMLIFKAALRCSHSFHSIDPKQKLEEGINISPDTIATIQRLMPNILKRETNTELTSMQCNNYVFKLASAPNLIFKMNLDPDLSEASEARFANMIKAKKICIFHGLDQLIIPNAKKFQVDTTTLIAENCVDIAFKETAQEALYHSLSGLTETVRQLVQFIAKTGFSDVEWRNIPIAEASPEFPGQRRIALVDLEEMQGTEIGIFGNDEKQNRRRGLIKCLPSEELIDFALDEAERQGMVHVNPEQIKEQRMREIQSYRDLQQFYAAKGIVGAHRQNIRVDNLESLDLNLDEQASAVVRETIRDTHSIETSIRREQIFTLRDVVQDIIAEINDLISRSPEDESLKGKRLVKLITSRGRLSHCKYLGLPKGRPFDAGKDQIWIRRIIHALVEKGHLFKLDEDLGSEYWIQA